MRKWIFLAIAGYLWKKYGTNATTPATRSNSDFPR